MKLIRLAKACPDMVLAQDVFTEGTSTNAFLRSGVSLTARAISRLQAMGIEKIYVEDAKDDAPGEEAPPKDRQSPLLHLKQLPVQRAKPVITGALQAQAVQSVKQAFEDISVHDTGISGSTKLIGQMGGIVDRLVRTLTISGRALVDINNLKSFDDFTFHHSLSVAVLSISIGRHLGFSSRQLGQLGLAAIMHDIGKTAVPVEIIRKPARLSSKEFSLVKTHSRLGTGYLMDSNIGDDALWLAVLFHHERMDGSGYPLGLQGKKIPLWSRIISVADVYDALTSVRPHRTSLQPADALEYVMGGAGTLFDYDIVTALVQKLDLYPVGSCVELSNRRLAVVLNSENQMRPVVELLPNGEVLDLFRERQCLNLVIKRVVPEAELYDLLQHV